MPESIVNNCPFYGMELRELVPGSPAIFFPTGLNQCAQMTDEPKSCAMAAGAHWKRCLRNPANAAAFADVTFPATLRLVMGVDGPPLVRLAHDAVDSIETPAEPITFRDAMDWGEKFEAHAIVEPDTPASVAEKARQAREIGHRFADLRKADPTPLLSKIDGDTLSEVKEDAS